MTCNYKKYLLYFFLIFAPIITSATEQIESGHVIKIDSICHISTEHPAETIIFFDIDDTLFDSPHMLGSKAWRRYIAEATKDNSQNWHDFFSLFLAQHFPLTTVEPQTRELVEELQRKGYGVCGLTARERQIWYDTHVKGIDALTIQQLASVDIHFNDEAFKNMYPSLAEDSEYFNGVFFANTELKGPYLEKILEKIVQSSSQSSRVPKKILFIDDKLSQITSVASILKEMKIDHECYWYCATDDKATKFNPLIANIQLYHFLKSGQVISDQEAKIFGQQCPEKDANDYLHAILDISRSLNWSLR